jgi:hypothetical protein
MRMNYTENMLKQELGSHIKEFYEWMNGQTVSVAKDGTFIYYESDVQRFKRLKGLR